MRTLRAWHNSMTPHKGWHSRGYLPHFDSPETVQFVTFRLADSLPKAVAEALRHREDDVHRIERELDVGLGACWLGVRNAGLTAHASDWAWSSARLRKI